MKGKVLKTIRNIFDGLMIFLLFITTTVYALPSDGVTYDCSISGSSATNVNDALNDLYSKLNQKQEEINNINNIGNAASNHILSGYTAYVKGKTITGSIPNKGATTYTPGTSNQTIGVGNYISGVQTIKGDANLVAGNIAKGKSIFGVNGTYTSDANATASNILSGKTAYVNGSRITGAIPNRSAVSGGAEGVVGLNSDIWKNVAVSPFDGALHWLTNTDGVKRLCLQAPYGVYGGKNNPGGLNGDGYVGIEVSRFGNAQASQVLNTATFTSQNGMSITGTIASKGATTYTPGVSNQTIASGQYLSGAQTIKGDANLVAGNIAKGKTIFGVTGTASCSNEPVSSYSNVLTSNAYTYYMVKTYGRNIKVQLKNEAGTVTALTYVTAYGQNSVYPDDSVIYASPYETKLTVDKNTGIIADSGSYEYIMVKNHVSGTPKLEFVFTWL